MVLTVPLHDGADPRLGDLVAADLDRVGVSAATDVIPEGRLGAYREMVDEAVRADADLLPADRLDAEYGRVVFLPHHEPGFLDLLEVDRLIDPCDRVLGADATLYTMTSGCQPAGGSGRSLHVDTSIAVPGFTVGLGVLVLLDDFDERSGPTRFFPEETIAPPDADEFERRALELHAPAGSACWFRARQWHDAMANRTDHWRRCLILALVRPWVRQRFDMARMVPTDPAELSPRVQQKLGFDLLAPGSYDEYYLPAGERRSALLDRARRP